MGVGRDLFTLCFAQDLNHFLQQSVSRMLLDNEPWVSKFKMIMRPPSMLAV
jgi:hypothetical protein